MQQTKFYAVGARRQSGGTRRAGPDAGLPCYGRIQRHCGGRRDLGSGQALEPEASGGGRVEWWQWCSG
jgi:hypothetical protein